jgi:hypothetical protein
VKILIIIISRMGVFKVIMTINMWSIKFLTKNHFQMEDDNIYEVGYF